MTLPAQHYLDGSALADEQSAIFASPLLPTPAFIAKWMPWLLAQEAVTPTNLTLRQRVLMAALLDEQTSGGRNYHIGIARDQYNALHHNGYWKEGYSYWLYVRKAFEWCREVRAFDFVSYGMLDDNYSRLVFPDGTLPLPETRDTDRLPFGDATTADDWQDVDDPAFHVHKWVVGEDVKAQILICKETFVEPRNLHSHPCAGVVSLWLKGQRYVMRPAAYTGFDLQAGITSRAVAENLPEGAILPTWRLKPPVVRWTKAENSIAFSWWMSVYDSEIPIVTRLIKWSNEKVTIIDNGQSRSWTIG